MTRYWENASGVYDPVATKVIKNESKRNKEVHDTINKVKNILADADLVLIDRMIIKDKLTSKTWR